VVRRKARDGPIGVDNSELINLEYEKEFKERNQHILDLYKGGVKEEEEDEEGAKDNDRFLNRLTHGLNQEQEDKAQTHGEWARRKEHELKLKDRLVQEAKKDLAEKMLSNYMDTEHKKEQRRVAMIEWQERKKLEDDMKKAQKDLEHKEKGRQQLIKKELGYQNYKEWLKKSMLKQREDQIQTRLEKERKRQEDDREKKAKANLKIMSKIAFKEWKDKKK